MAKFSGKTIDAIRTLLSSVDCLISMRIHDAEGFTPKGKVQDCDAGPVMKEWVDQSGPGLSGDSFSGTVTWKLGRHYIVAGFYT